jgi:hypothetical protein
VASCKTCGKQQVSLKRETTSLGFEPAWGDRIGLAGRPLNHSAKVALLRCVRDLMRRMKCVAVCRGALRAGAEGAGGGVKTLSHANVRTAFRIPFGDHPLKLERYRED